MAAECCSQELHPKEGWSHSEGEAIEAVVHGIQTVGRKMACGGAERNMIKSFPQVNFSKKWAWLKRGPEKDAGKGVQAE